MSDLFRNAEASLAELEFRLASDYESTKNRSLGDYGNKIPNAPETVNDRIVEGGRLFKQAWGSCNRYADADDIPRAEELFEQAFAAYEDAIGLHIDHMGKELVDVDLAISLAESGYIDEEGLYDQAGIPMSVGWNHVRRRVSSDEALEILQGAEEDASELIKNDYLDELEVAREQVLEGLENLRQD